MKERSEHSAVGDRMLAQAMDHHGMLNYSPPRARERGEVSPTQRLSRSDSVLLAMHEMDALKENSSFQCAVGNEESPDGMRMVRRTQKAVADLEVDILDHGEAKALDSATAQKLRWVQRNNKGSPEKLTPQHVREAQRELAASRERQGVA